MANGKAGTRMNNDILGRITGVFRELFENDELIITEDTSSDDIKDWDSYMHINLTKMIEDEFGIEFTVSQLVSFNNVRDIINAINESTENR